MHTFSSLQIQNTIAEQQNSKTVNNSKIEQTKNREKLQKIVRENGQGKNASELECVRLRMRVCDLNKMGKLMFENCSLFKSSTPQRSSA